MDKKQTEALRIATESLPMLKIAASLGDETGQISFHSSHLLNLIEGYAAGQQEIASLRAQLEAVGAGGVEPLRKRCLHQISEPAQAQPVVAAPWQPIATAPEGHPVVVFWLDAEDVERPERHEFDYLEDGVWQKHDDYYQHFCAVAPPGSCGPRELPPYTHWMPLTWPQDGATTPQPAARALDSVRVFWQQHTHADALSMTMAELHADVELVIRAARGAALAALKHPAVKPDMLVNGGALKLALNVLRRAGKNEVADELECTAQAAPVDAAVQQDAERLDFMIESCTQVATISPSGRKYLCYPDGRMQAGSYPTARAAIDAAAQKGKHD